MNLKNKLAKIKNKIAEIPDSYITGAFMATSGIVFVATGTYAFKKVFGDVDILLVDKKTVRTAKEEGLPIVFRNIDNKWYFKNEDRFV